MRAFILLLLALVALFYAFYSMVVGYELSTILLSFVAAGLCGGFSYKEYMEI